MVWLPPDDGHGPVELLHEHEPGEAVGEGEARERQLLGGPIQHRRGEFGQPDGPDGYDVPGLEVAGTIAEVGAGAAGLVEGEQVAAYLPAFGGYAEYAVSDASLVRSIGGVEPAVAAGLARVVTSFLAAGAATPYPLPDRIAAALSNP